MRIEEYEIGHGTSCAIALDFGCNLFSWKVDGREIFYAPPGFPQKGDRFFDGGNPILFPSVGRTWWRKGPEPRADTYFLAGRKEPLAMPLHGLLASAEWRKFAEQTDTDRIHLTYAASLPASVREAHYPFPVEFRQTFTLSGSSLQLEAFFVNRGSDPAPMAFGYHPYFRINPDRRVAVALPCAYSLGLDPDLLVPTGRTVPVVMPVDVEPDSVLDNVFTGLPRPKRPSLALLYDESSELDIRIDCDESIETFVIYHPAGAEFLCLEPWTRGLGGYEGLGNPHWEQSADLLVLQPGQEKRISVRYSALSKPLR